MNKKILKFPDKKILQFPNKNFDDKKIISINRGIKLIENIEFLKKFFETFGCKKDENNCVIKICPDEIEEKCGAEIKNFIMENLIFDEGHEDYNGKFFGYVAKIKPHYKFLIEKYDFNGIKNNFNLLCECISLDYYDLRISRKDYDEIQAKIY